MQVNRKAAFAAVLAGILSCGLAAAEDEPVLIEIPPDSSGPNYGYVVETSHGVGIYQFDGQLLLQTSEGHLLPLDPLDINEDIIIAWPDDIEEYSTVEIKGHLCRWEKPCMDGWLTNTKLNLAGCFKIPVVDWCLGSCYSCTGSQNGMYKCYPSEHEQDACVLDKFGTVMPRVDCGEKFRILNGCSHGATGAGPNGCGCKTTNSSNTQQRCKPNQCLPPQGAPPQA